MKLPSVGETLQGKYLLERELGEGGMGVVFAARQTLLNQRVAVKLIRPEYATQADAVGRFLNEARAASSIESDHIARVLDFGILDLGLPYMVLEYLEGADLASVLASRGPLPVSEVVDGILQAIEALAHAHALGIVHRDIKPSNLFLAKRPDGTARVKVLDFGISKMTEREDGAFEQKMTRTNSMLGSPLYSSPEQLRDAKGVDQRTDIWALGVCLYELLSGRAPFEATNVVALFAAIQESEPLGLVRFRPDVSPDLDAVVMRCLRRRPEERFASVTALALALAPFGSGRGAASVAAACRILPLGATTGRGRGSSPDAIAPTPSPRGEQLPRLGETTAAPVSTTIRAMLPPNAPVAPVTPRQLVTTTTPARRSRGALAGVVAASTLLVVAGIGLFVVTPRLRGAKPGAPLVQAVPERTPEAPPVPPSATATAIVTATAAVPPVPSAEASTHAAPQTPIPARRTPPRPPPTPSTKPATKPPSPAQPCAPYSFGPDGVKIWHPECIE